MKENKEHHVVPSRDYFISTDRAYKKWQRRRGYKCNEFGVLIKTTKKRG